ncbi:MAG: caspase family protein [Bacteroidales bacterium]|nr:caspase family protein [Bacteroidales bacterium]
MLNIDPKSTKVILIGVSEFQDKSFINAPPIRNNVAKLNELLQDEKIIGILQKNILILDKNETHSEIYKKIKEFLEQDFTDTVIFYFAGHGYKTDNGKFFFVTNNTIKSFITGTALPWDKIKMLCEEGSGIQQRFYIIDACHSGAAALGDDDEELELEDGSALIAAAKADSKSYFQATDQYTYFTDALINILESGIQNIEQPELAVKVLYKQLYDNLKNKNFDLTIKTTDKIDNVTLFKNRSFDKVAILLKEGDEYFIKLNFIDAEKCYKDALVEYFDAENPDKDKIEQIKAKRRIALERQKIKQNIQDEIIRKQEEERKANDQAELRQKQEEERKAKEQAELKQQQEEEQRAKEQTELKQKQEGERKDKEQAELKRKQDEEKKANEQAELKQKKDQEQKINKRAEFNQKPKDRWQTRQLEIKTARQTAQKRQLSLILLSIITISIIVILIWQPWKNKANVKIQEKIGNVNNEKMGNVIIEAEKNFAICKACHTIGGGKLIGPDLQGVTERREEAWLIKFIQNPQAMIDAGDPIAVQVFEENNKIPMPPNSRLSEEQIKDMLLYIESGGVVAGVEVAEEDEIGYAPGNDKKSSDENKKSVEIIWLDNKNGYFIDPRDQVKYKVAKIGNQTWMAENLKAIKYNDGNAIPLVSDKTGWSELKTPGYCWYNNDEAANKNTYGALYNWYAVNTGKLCPTGWHVPTDEEWKVLEGAVDSQYAIGDNTWDEESVFRGFDAGMNLKTTSGWYENGNGSDLFGFSALPGGFRLSRNFGTLGYYVNWWSATEYSSRRAWYRSLNYESDRVYRNYNHDKEGGFSVRCLRD